MSGERASSIAEAYRGHGHHVLRRALRLLGNVADANDVMHEVFLDLLANPEQFAGRSALTTWLYAATTNRCLNRIRDSRTRARLLDAHGRIEPTSTAPAHAEDTAELRRLLLRLPDDLAKVAIYYFGDEMTQNEIADVMGCSRRHVVTLVTRLEDAVKALETNA